MRAHTHSESEEHARTQTSAAPLTQTLAPYHSICELRSFFLLFFVFIYLSIYLFFYLFID